MSTPDDCARRFPDDPTVADQAELLRRIPPRHFVFDEGIGRVRPSSAAFEDDADGDPMSAYRRDIVDSETGGLQRVMAGHAGFGLASLTARQFRFEQQTICPDPLPEESSHAKICGPKPHSVRRRLAKQAIWAIEPPISHSLRVALSLPPRRL